MEGAEATGTQRGGCRLGPPRGAPGTATGQGSTRAGAPGAGVVLVGLREHQPTPLDAALDRGPRAPVPPTGRTPCGETLARSGGAGPRAEAEPRRPAWLPRAARDDGNRAHLGGPSPSRRFPRSPPPCATGPGVSKHTAGPSNADQN